MDASLNVYIFLLLGDLVVIFPRAFHMGVNLDMTVCEALNGASKAWVEIGEKSIPCQCGEVKDQPEIDYVLARGT